MKASSHSQKPAGRLFAALIGLLCVVLTMALLKGTLFSRLLSRSTSDLNTFRVAAEAESQESRLTADTISSVLSDPDDTFLRKCPELAGRLTTLQNTQASLQADSNWESGGFRGAEFTAYQKTLLGIFISNRRSQAAALLPLLMSQDAALGTKMQHDVTNFSSGMTARTAQRLWWFGIFFPGACAFIVISLTAILLPPALRRIRRANEMLVTLESASATQAAELEERNRELQAQQEILRMHEAELIMRTEQLEATSNGSQQAARRFEELFQGLPVACVGFSSDGQIFEWNRASTDLYGHEAYQILHEDLWGSIAEPAFRRRGKSLLRRVFAGNEIRDAEWSYERADGERRHVLGHLFPVRGLDGRILGGIASCLDVTDRKRAEDELRASEKLFRDLIDSLHEGVLLYDSSGRIVVANRQAGDLIGAPKPSLLGRKANQLRQDYVGPDLCPLSLEELPYMRCLSTGTAVEEALVGWLERSDDSGAIRWFSVNAIPLTRSDEEAPYGVLSSFSEVTERLLHEAELKNRQGLLEQANSKLETLAVTDGLTGLYNHRAFQEQLETAVAQSPKHLSLILVDIDHFKSYNDSFGHPEGDRVLRDVAALLRKTLGDKGIAARYGGEEFGLILPDQDVKSAAEFGKVICEAIANAHWPHRAITISAGVATINHTIGDQTSLIRAADEALYASKHAGRNRSKHFDTISKGRRRAA